MNATCPPKPKLDQFLAGGLASAEELAVEDHVEHCSECQRYLVGLTADTTFAEKLVAANAANREIPDSLRRRAAVEYPAEAATAGHGEPTGGTRSPLVGDPPNIPGYEVLSVLGQGGLAVVYQGVHRQLRRTVALKVLRQQPMHDERERLRREAGALAGLRHSNIVQIHEAGEVDGRPYLVLEYIAGGSLSRRIAGRPVPPKQAAKIVASAASAVHAAHKKGLVHRDLKPGNILLDFEGQLPGDDLSQCRPKLTDFGLVRDVAVDSDLTHKRDLIGTPAYMAPEQAAGQNDVGPTVDIWALGAVLYELLTGRPPFQGPSALDTLFQVRFSDVVPPTQLQPKVPRDLETICLKCLSKNPNERYATAKALSDDLNRWLTGRPVEARRTAPWVRVWRWCQRNPLAASLATIASVLLIALAIGGPVVAIRESGLRKIAADRATQAESERQRAGANLDLATQALDDTIRQMYASFNVRPETIPDMDNGIVGATVPYLERLVAQNAVTTEQRLQRTRAKRQLARGLPVPRETQRCKELFADADKELSVLVKELPDRRDIQRELALCRFELGRFLMLKTRDGADGEAEINRAIKMQEDLVAADPNDAQACEELGNSLSTIGENLARNITRRPEAKPYLTRALDIRKQLRTSNKNSRNNLPYAMNESFTRLWLARTLIAMNDYVAAIEVIDEGLRVQRAIVALKPDDSTTMFILAHLEQHMGYSLANLGRWDEAMPYLDVSAQRYDHLAAALPGAAKLNEAAITCHDSYANLMAKKKAWTGAVQHAAAGLAIAERFSAVYPRNPVARADVVVARCRLAAMQAYAGQGREAVTTAEVVRSAANAIDMASLSGEGRCEVAAAFVALAEAILGNDAAMSLDFCDRALAAIGEGETESPFCRGVVALLNKAYATRAKALSALGRSNETRGKEEPPPGARRDTD